MKKLLLILALAPTLLLAQSKKQRRALAEQQKADQLIINNLKAHVQKLAANSQADDKAEEIAVEYISNQFKAIGLQPKGTNSYLQPFIIEEGKQIGSGTYLSLNGNRLELNKDFIPLAYSATKTVAGMPAMALREKGVPWFVDVKDWVVTNAANTNYNINEAIQKEAVRAAAKGATALFVYNSTNTPDKVNFDTKDKSTASPIPVIYIMPEGYKKYFVDQSQLLDIEMRVTLDEKNRSSNNVVGFIDNGAPATIVIGANYNLLNTTTYTSNNGQPTVNSIEDNAGRASMLIELAKMLAASKAKSNNYLFIAFGGRPPAVAGSKFWIDNPTISAPLNYMINLEKVSSYDASKKLSIAGYGSSSAWAQVVSVSDKTLPVKLDSTAASTSDYMYFHNKNIPALSFYTETSENTRETDKAGKINYEGKLQIAKYITRLIEATDNKGKIAFSKMRETTSSGRNTVSLGVIPDNNFNSGGVKISGVSPQKTADKLGLTAGDILVQLGSYQIKDMNSYLQALSNFKAGDKTTLKIKRGKEDKEFPVEF